MSMPGKEENDGQGEKKARGRVEQRHLGVYLLFVFDVKDIEPSENEKVILFLMDVVRKIF